MLIQMYIILYITQRNQTLSKGKDLTFKAKAKDSHHWWLARNKLEKSTKLQTQRNVKQVEAETTQRTYN